MNAKAQLAVLFSLMNQKEPEYKNSSAFAAMEQAPEIVKGIEIFHLPEVTRLICCSDILLQESWAEPYKVLSVYIRNEDFDPREVFKLVSKDILEKDILAFDYPPVIKRLHLFCDRVKQKYDELSQEGRSLSGKIRSINKQISELTDKTDLKGVEQDSTRLAESKAADIAALQQELDSLNDKLTANRKETEKYKTYINNKQNKAFFELICAAFSRCTDNGYFDPIRDKAYEIVEELQTPGAIEFIQAYTRDGVLYEEFAELLKTESFQKKFITAFEDEQLSGYAFPVIVRLYAENAIDIELPFISDFIKKHIELLTAFFIDQHSIGNDWLTSSEYQALLDQAIRYTIESKTPNRLVDYWSLMSDDEWVDLVDRIEQYSPDRLIENLCKFIHGLSDDCARHFLSMVSGGVLSDKVYLPELFSEMISLYDSEDYDLIIDYLRNLESSKKKVLKLQRQIDRQPSEIFSALYSSIQQLEELAISLRYTDGTIKCNLVARQIIDAAINVREGLNALGLETVVEPEDWKLQNSIEYDPEKHSDSGLGIVPGKKVQMKTMGFCYLDDEKEKRIHPAEAFIPREKRSINIPNHSGNPGDGKKDGSIQKGNNPSYQKPYYSRFVSTPSSKSSKHRNEGNGGKHK